MPPSSFTFAAYALTASGGCLEQARHDAAEVGDHADADLVVGDADVGGELAVAGVSVARSPLVLADRLPHAAATKREQTAASSTIRLRMCPPLCDRSNANHERERVLGILDGKMRRFAPFVPGAA